MSCSYRANQGRSCCMILLGRHHRSLNVWPLALQTHHLQALDFYHGPLLCVSDITQSDSQMSQCCAPSISRKPLPYPWTAISPIYAEATPADFWMPDNAEGLCAVFAGAQVFTHIPGICRTTVLSTGAKPSEFCPCCTGCRVSAASSQTA